ncbi:MAG: mevalonate kinase [Tetragenococcus sp.]|nr:mevalonate kinase [Tetragenococcus sp.]
MLVQGNGHSNGKIILIGEHSVVYGEPAIAFPFSGTQVNATVQQAEKNFLASCYYVGYLEGAPEQLQSVTQLAYKLQTELHTPHFQLDINSTVPAARGMGSSAAVAVAVTRAFFAWSEQELNQKTLLFFVDFAENIAHGNPSGIDAAAASGNEPIFFERKQQVTTFPMNMNAHLLVADTGMLGQTREAVQSVSERLQAFHNKTFSAIQELGVLTDQAKEAIIANQPEVLGEIMNQAQDHLRSLTVSNQRLDDFIHFSLENGALGAKLTGGGRGGCFLALTKTKEQAELLAQRLQKRGIKKSWIQGLGVYQYA